MWSAGDWPGEEGAGAGRIWISWPEVAASNTDIVVCSEKYRSCLNWKISNESSIMQENQKSLNIELQNFETPDVTSV